MRLAVGVCGVIAIASSAALAQQLRVDEVVDRVAAYVTDYEIRFAAVVSQETYTQKFETPARPRGLDPFNIPPMRQVRTLVSDYALTRAGRSDVLVGYRDTFDVDGKPVRHRDTRLQDLIAGGAAARASQLTAESARYNLPNSVFSGNVNVPTFALQLLHPRYRSRFKVRKSGDVTIDGQRCWRLEFDEQVRPTLVRRNDGGDQRSRIIAVVNPETGEVLRTTIAWDALNGDVDVVYARVPELSMLVPTSMIERFRRAAASFDGEAIYTDFRQFQTGGRLIEP